MSASRAMVRSGLARLVADGARWPAPTLTILRNLLLDECGGDARPLVAILVKAAELDVPARIQAGQAHGTPWERSRGALVVSLVHESFLQAEIAQWAVDAWGVALGAVAERGVADASPVVARSPREGTSRAVPRASRTGGASGAAPSVSGPTRAGTAGGTGSGGGWRPVATTTGTAWSGSGARVAPTAGASRRIAPVSPLEEPAVRVSLALLALVALGALAIIVRGVLASPRGGPSGAAIAAPAPMVGTDSAARMAASPGAGGVADRVPDGAPLISGAALPALDAADSARLMPVRPAQRASGAVGASAEALVREEFRGSNTGVAPLPSPTSAPVTASPRAPDRVMLRRGGEMIGRVEIIRPSTVVFRELSTGLRYELEKRAVRAITTEFGTTVRFDDDGLPASSGGRADAGASSRNARAYGGRYALSYVLRGVEGTPACQGIERRQGLPSDQLAVRHDPGADTLMFVFARGGQMAGVVDDAGRFTTNFAITPGQAATSSALTARLAGRFTADGFTGTVTVLAYRRLQGRGGDIACQATFSASGRRLGPG